MSNDRREVINIHEDFLIVQSFFFSQYININVMQNPTKMSYVTICQLLLLIILLGSCCRFHIHYTSFRIKTIALNKHG